MLKYLKAAFKQPWNLLAFCGAAGFALLSGQIGVALPLVLAGEAIYLGFFGTHRKFQDYVDAREAKSAREENSARNVVTLEQLRKALPDSSRRRYEELLQSCRRLRQIALDLKQPGAEASLDSLQIEGLDRLLWIFLRLLFTEYSLRRFLDQTSRDDIERDSQAIQTQLSRLDPKDESPRTVKIRHTLEDSLATARNRLENYDRAQSNREFAQLELARLETKIKALAELAVNRQEPDYISTQIDQVAHSMLDTEKTMNELQYVTGLDPSDEHAPAILTATEQAGR